MYELETFNFNEDEVQLITDTRDGSQWIPVTRLAENIGIDPYNQRKKVQDDPKFSSRDIMCPGKDGKKYKMISLPKDEVGAWLFSVNSNKIKNPDVRKNLIQYQKTLVTAIHDFTTKGIAVNKEKQNGSSLAQQALIMAQALVDQEKQIQEVKEVQEQHSEKITEIEDQIETNYSAIPGEFSILTPEEYEISDEDISTLRRRITTLIQFIAKFENLTHREIWSSSYNYYNERRRINLQARASNRGCRAIDVLEDENRLKDFYDLTYRYWRVFDFHHK